MQIRTSGSENELKQQLQLATEQIDMLKQRLQTYTDELERERLQLRLVAEASAEGLLFADARGCVRSANPLATWLLATDQQTLIGRPLSECLPPEAAAVLQEHWRRWQKSQIAATPIEIAFRATTGQAAVMTLIAITDAGRRLCGVQVRLRPTIDQRSFETRSLYLYYRGETIPARTQSIWLIREGVVKLSTCRYSGEEVLVGLLGPSMVFGDGVTGLTSWQASALSDVQLMNFSLREIENSPVLLKMLFAPLKQRLQQAEALLAITGQLQAEARLRDLLLLLKQQIGEPVPGGTRLNVRLTHQDLANAIGVTRVTVSNQMNKLKKKGQIHLDAKQHILLSDRLGDEH